MIKKLIRVFLDTYATKVQDGDNVELMMDDHTYIEYEDEGYYIPENNSSYTEDDEYIVKLLNTIYSL